MTLIFAATSAILLVVLATIASRTDHRSRTERLDNNAVHQADGLARTLYFDEFGDLPLELFEDDDLDYGAEVLGVLQTPLNGSPQIRFVQTEPSDLPNPSDLNRMWQRVRLDEQTVSITARARDGRRYRWAVAPVWKDDVIGAVVVVGTDTAQSRSDHARLVRRLAWGCAALVLTATVIGHLLTGRAIRPAARGLEQQEQFLAEAAHELRTPLATLRVVIETGRTAPGGPDAALSHAARQVDRLSRLVTALLARARVEIGTQDVERTPLRLDQLVEQVIEELPDSSRVGTTTEPSVVDGDPELLTQAIRNLVENALRHGGGTPVEVIVSPGRVAVRDHGPGVPAEDLERVFARRVAGSGSGGTGTGLAIVRWVAQLHGGTARLSQPPGGGTLAELELPGRIGK
jgi:two-component system, OmpR family, sensor kinase